MKVECIINGKYLTINLLIFREDHKKMNKWPLDHPIVSGRKCDLSTYYRPGPLQTFVLDDLVQKKRTLMYGVDPVELKRMVREVDQSISELNDMMKYM